MSRGRPWAAVHLRCAQRTQHRVLVRELSAYRSGRETEDLLASCDRVGDEAAEIRDVLSRPSPPLNNHFIRAI